MPDGSAEANLKLLKPDKVGETGVYGQEDDGSSAVAQDAKEPTPRQTMPWAGVQRRGTA